MPSEDEMTKDERRKYLKKQQQRYREAARNERGHLWQEMEQVTGLHRKSLTRLMNASSLERTRRKTPRPRSYSQETEQVICEYGRAWWIMCVPNGSPRPYCAQRGIWRALGRCSSVPRWKSS